MRKDFNCLFRYKILRRNVKYARLEIKNDLVYVILPKNSDLDFRYILSKYKNWIDKKLLILNEIRKISKNLELFNHNDFEDFVLRKIEDYSEIFKQKPSAVVFRLMKRRWGSCHSNNKIIFNKLLRFLPKELIEYVIIHEMCHLKIKNHKKEFWLLVKKFCPDYAEKEKLLVGHRIKLNSLKIYYSNR